MMTRQSLDSQKKNNSSKTQVARTNVKRKRRRLREDEKEILFSCLILLKYLSWLEKSRQESKDIDVGTITIYKCLRNHKLFRNISHLIIDIVSKQLM